MKALLVIFIGSIPVMASADYVRCHTQNVCLKRVTACSQSNRDTVYDRFSGIVTAYARHVVELEKQKICFGKRATPIEISESHESVIWSSGNVATRELRMPESLQDVPADLLKEAEVSAKESCEASRQLTLETYEICK